MWYAGAGGEVYVYQVESLKFETHSKPNFYLQFHGRVHRRKTRLIKFKY